ncbi:MAG: Ig-like domain-containing protein [Deltaproteobacteria bacterium]|nr:Ig-like domain-containing protein [Deltaproteobacteria bacterium]
MSTHNKHKGPFLKWMMALLLVVGGGLLTLSGCSSNGENGQGAGESNPSGEPSDSPTSPARFSVKATAPVDGEIDVNTDQKIAVQFDDEVDVSTANSTNIRVTTDDGEEVEGTVTVDNAHNIAVFTPGVQLENSTTHHLEVTRGVKSSVGISLDSDVTVTFTTSAEDKEEPAPTVTETTPTEGEVDVDVSNENNIEVYFDEALDASTVNADNIKLKKEDGSEVTINITYDLSLNVVIISPTTSLEVSTSYLLEILVGVENLTDISLAESVEINFSTTAEAPPEDDDGEDDCADADDDGEDDCEEEEEDGGEEAPEVVSTTPTEGSVDVSTSQEIKVQFDQAMDVSTINETNIKLTTDDGSAVEASITYDAETNVAIVTPTAELEASTAYHLEVTTGCVSETSVALESSTMVNFTTTAAEGEEAPEVTSVEVSTSQAIAVHFDQEMDVSTLNEANINLTTENGDEVAVEITYDSTTNVAIVTPDAELEVNSTYHLEVTTGVESAANVALESNYEADVTVQS